MAHILFSIVPVGIAVSFVAYVNDVVSTLTLPI